MSSLALSCLSFLSLPTASRPSVYLRLLLFLQKVAVRFVVPTVLTPTTLFFLYEAQAHSSCKRSLRCTWLVQASPLNRSAPRQLLTPDNPQSPNFHLHSPTLHQKISNAFNRDRLGSARWGCAQLACLPWPRPHAQRSPGRGRRCRRCRHYRHTGRTRAVTPTGSSEQA